VAIILPPQPWTKQPQIAVGISRQFSARPIYVVNPAVGNIDLVSGSLLSSGSGTSRTTNGYGKAIRSSSSQASVYQTAIRKPTTASILWVGNFLGTPDISAALGGLTYDNANSSPYVAIELKRYSAVNSDLYMNWNDGTTFRSIIVNSGSNTGLVTAVGVVGTNSQALYVNNNSGGASFASTIAYGTDPRLEFGESLNARNPNAEGNLLVIFDGALSDNEARSLVRNPWQVFAPLSRRIFVGPAAAGGAYTLTADAGSYTIAGQDATLTKNSVLTADAGSYAIAGQDATLSWAGAGAYTLTADVGAYVIAGQDATLTWASPGAYTLTAEAGAYVIAGQDATLLKSSVLTADVGAYTIAGQDATLTKAAAAAYTLTAEAGAYVISGQSAILTNSGEVIPVVTEGPTIGISWGALVRKTWGKEWAEPEWDYQFSNGRRFKEKKNPYS